MAPVELKMRHWWRMIATFIYLIELLADFKCSECARSRPYLWSDIHFKKVLQVIICGLKEIGESFKAKSTA